MRSTAAPWTLVLGVFFWPKTHLEPLKNDGWKRSLLKLGDMLVLGGLKQKIPS